MQINKQPIEFFFGWAAIKISEKERGAGLVVRVGREVGGVKVACEAKKSTDVRGDPQ
jgi:hypothetical protein